jgi:hypothetical protein
MELKRRSEAVVASQGYVMEVVKVYVWTKKAEAEYRSRHPGKECERIAGEEALYDGRPLLRDYAEAFRERGWIKSDSEPAKIMQRPRRVRPKKYEPTQEMLDKQKERWKELQYLMGQGKPIRAIAELMGLSSGSVLSKFVRIHGIYLANMYGKLPRAEKRYYGMMAKYWKKVME